MLTWQVLIATIPHRQSKLRGLLARLDKQVQPGFGVLLYQDNLRQPVAVKRQVLLEASEAEYVSFLDDDDTVPDVFVPRVMHELSGRPDYVGFIVSYFVDGVQEARAVHSLRYSGWHGPMEAPPGPEPVPDEVYTRDISHLNPIRRELALLGRFYDGSGDEDLYKGEDGRWADQVRESGQVKTEAWIGEVMYWYQFAKEDCHRTIRKPYVEDWIVSLPSYPWLKVIGR